MILDKKDEIAIDLIKVNLINILEWVPIDETEFSKLTPFQQEIKDLAVKYGIPSPNARNEPTILPPSVPEGKVHNG